MVILSRAVIAGLGLLGGLSSVAMAQSTFTSLGVGQLPTGVSDDGSVVSGNGYNPMGATVFTWSAGTETILHQFASGSATSGSAALSGDGRVVARTLHESSGQMTAHRWESLTGWINLGGLSGSCDAFTSSAYGTNTDGSVVVGLGWEGCKGRAFRWSAATGMVQLPGFDPVRSQRANCVSGDGTVVGGWDEATNGQRRAVLWYSDSRGEVLLIPPSAQNPNGAGEVWDLNSDGTIACGWSDTTSGRKAFLWRQGVGMQLLGNGWASATVEDGSLVFVNDGSAPLLPGAIPATVSVWTPEDGLVNLAAYLQDQNVAVPAGTPLTYVSDVSPDGRYVVGRRGVPFDPTQPLEGFFIEMPPGLRYGVNSTAVANTLDIVSGGSGSIGQTFEARTTMPGPAGFILIGQRSWSFPYLGGEVLVDLTIPLLGQGPLIPNASGVATTRLPIPNNPVFIGVTLFFQSVAIDASTPFGWGFSPGLKLHVRP